MRRTVGLQTVFMALLVITAGGIVYHYLSGYHYPATQVTDYEINVLGDIYELFFIIPVGVIGLWLLRKGSQWGPLLMAGVATHFAYNYAMFVTGRQNLWIFLWTCKLALAGVAVCLLWSLLPTGPKHRCKPSVTIAIYLALVLIVFSKMMGQRLLASATGQAMDMTMQGAGILDWGEPFLRDPIIFFALAGPVVVTAILGLLRGTDWGARAASLSSVFLISIVTVVLFTGPLKEYLQSGSVSSAMWMMSMIMVVAALPAVWSLIWLTKPTSDV